jgi:hypothetical protein
MKRIAACLLVGLVAVAVSSIARSSPLPDLPPTIEQRLAAIEARLAAIEGRLTKLEGGSSSAPAKPLATTAPDGWPEPQRTEWVDLCITGRSVVSARQQASAYCECVVQAVEQEWTHESFQAQSDSPAKKSRWAEITESCHF